MFGTNFSVENDPESTQNRPSSFRGHLPKFGALGHLQRFFRNELLRGKRPGIDLESTQFHSRPSSQALLEVRRAKGAKGRLRPTRALCASVPFALSLLSPLSSLLSLLSLLSLSVSSFFSFPMLFWVSMQVRGRGRASQERERRLSVCFSDVRAAVWGFLSLSLSLQRLPKGPCLTLISPSLSPSFVPSGFFSVYVHAAARAGIGQAGR